MFKLNKPTFTEIAIMVINMSDIQLFQILKQKMGEQEAEALVTFVDHKIKDNNESNLNILATKGDIHLLKEDVQLLKQDIQTVKLELKGNISNLEVKIADSKAEMIKWMFIFWIGQVAVTVGLIMIYLKK